MTREDEYKRIVALFKGLGYSAAAEVLAREIFDLKAAVAKHEQDHRVLGDEEVARIQQDQERIKNLRAARKVLGE